MADHACSFCGTTREMWLAGPGGGMSSLRRGLRAVICVDCARRALEQLLPAERFASGEGARSRALAMALRQAKEKPDDPDALRGAAEGLLQLGRSNEAKAWIARLAAHHEKKGEPHEAARTWLWSSRISMERSALEEARRLLAEAGRSEEAARVDEQLERLDHGAEMTAPKPVAVTFTIASGEKRCDFCDAPGDRALVAPAKRAMICERCVEAGAKRLGRP